MGVYIPNMEKPKDSCWECKAQYNSVCSLKREHIKFDGILDDCPLIEIVECGECKYEYSCGHQIKRNGLTLKLTCCEYGERRADEHTIQGT